MYLNTSINKADDMHTLLILGLITGLVDCINQIYYLIADPSLGIFLFALERNIENSISVDRKISVPYQQGIRITNNNGITIKLRFHKIQ